MPAYDYSCPFCGIVEVHHRMRDKPPRKCTKCGRGRFKRVFNVKIAFIGAVDAGQENNNGGMGDWYPQLGTQFLDAKTKTTRNPASHATSRYAAAEKAKRQGYQNVEYC